MAPMHRRNKAPRDCGRETATGFIVDATAEELNNIAGIRRYAPDALQLKPGCAIDVHAIFVRFHQLQAFERDRLKLAVTLRTAADAIETAPPILKTLDEMPP